MTILSLCGKKGCCWWSQPPPTAVFEGSAHSTRCRTQDTPLFPYQIVVPLLEAISARLPFGPLTIATELAVSSQSPTPLPPACEQITWPSKPYSVIPPKVPIAVIRSVLRLPAGSSQHSAWAAFTPRIGGVISRELRAALLAVGCDSDRSEGLHDAPAIQVVATAIPAITRLMVQVFSDDVTWCHKNPRKSRCALL